MAKRTKAAFPKPLTDTFVMIFMPTKKFTVWIILKTDAARNVTEYIC